MIPGNINTALISGAEGGGYQVQRSLRFNSSDSAFCSRTPASAGNRKTWTWAGWVKRSSLTAVEEHLWLAGVGQTTDTTYQRIYFDSNNKLRVSAYNFHFRITTQVFRDFSAWFHLVVAVDTTQATASNRVRVYVNGTEVTAFDTINNPAQNDDTGTNSAALHYIGAEAGPIRLFNGYLADIHFIDGQALTPSSFTEVSATTGQLIPKAYTGSFGTNGFWLKFSDNSAATATTLGKDDSGNSNNWTPNNLTATAKDYNAFVSATGTGGVNSKSNAFDNDLNTFASSATAGSSEGAVSLSFDFASIPITVSSTVRVYFNAGGGANVRKARINGGSYVNSNSSDYADFSLTGTLSSIDSTLGPAVGGGYSATIAAIDVDGVRLVSSPASNIDSLVDTPTSISATDTGVGGEVRGNYCTLNPLKIGSNATLANGNLDFSSSTSAGYNVALGTLGVSSGKWYWEITATAAASNGFGIANDKVNISDYLGGDANGWMYYQNTGSKYNNNSASSYGSSYTTNDVIGFAFDADAGSITAYKNGVSQGVMYSSLAAGTYFPAVSDSGAATCSSTANFGQRPFAYTAPSGFKALCDTNLPAPVVAKPSESAFDTKIWTGNGSNNRTIATSFSPDLVWCKFRNQSYSHGLFDTVRGADKRLRSNGTDAEDTVYLDFASNGFIVQGSSSFNDSGDSFVGWCWDAGSSTVTNTQGSITSQVRANASAGFSVVSWISNASASVETMGTGLGVSPSFVIVKNRDLNDNWVIYHQSLGTGAGLFFTTAAAFSSSPYWSVSSTTFGIRQNGIATGAQNCIAYCFAPVAGYSSFGSYTGNGSADGPFVFCNFRPRWVLFKNTNSGENWRIMDAARNTYNVANSILYPNLSNAEGSSAVGFDILSNGFKIRESGSELNASGATIVYAAFAESPFAYSRAR